MCRSLYFSRTMPYPAAMTSTDFDLASVSPSTLLEGDTIIVRRLEIADAEALYEAILESGRDLSGTTPWCHEGFSLDEARSWTDMCVSGWDAGKRFEFAVTDRQTGRYLGSCGLGPIDQRNRTANLGYWIRTSRAGQGIAGHAARLVARWACRELGLQRVEITTVTSNVRSRRAALKSGATHEGVLRNRVQYGAESYDMAVFSFIPADFDGTPS